MAQPALPLCIGPNLTTRASAPFFRSLSTNSHGGSIPEGECRAVACLCADCHRPDPISPLSFVRNAGLITASNVSIDCYVGRTVLRTLIVFCHHIVLYFLGLALLLVPLSWTSLLSLVGIALVFINGYWIGVVLAFLCARFRDLEQIIRNLLQLAFFMTPVFWKADLVVSNKRAIVDYNVLFYFIEIIRAPLLGQVPPLKYYAVALGCTIIGYLIAVLVYQRMRRRLAFFVV